MKWITGLMGAGLHRNVVAVSAASFLFQSGEELWQQFRSLYLRALGASEAVIGLFGSTEDTLDGLYQYPGGWAADHLGRRRALMLFAGIPVVGYVVYLAAPSWPFMFLGLPFVMAWASLASPSIFATIGDALPKEQRARGFIVQSILRRIPSILAPPLGGLMIDYYTHETGQASLGVLSGVRTGLAVSVVLALVTLWMQSRFYVELRSEPTALAGMRDVYRDMHRSLKALLLSDIFIRACDGMTDVFLVLYARDLVHTSGTAFGGLVAVAKVSSILSYLAVAKRADSGGRKPLAMLTFLCFALFPLAVALSRTGPVLLVAFVVNGLREIGEPSRKALIVDLASTSTRGRTIGLYYFIRSLAIAPAAAVGGVLYRHDPTLPFYVASAIGFVGAALFWLTVGEDDPAGGRNPAASSP